MDKEMSILMNSYNGCMKRLYGCNIINNSTEQIKIYLLRQVNKTFFNFKIGTIFQEKNRKYKAKDSKG